MKFVLEICDTLMGEYGFWDMQHTFTSMWHNWSLRYMLHADYIANIKNQTRHKIGFGNMQCTLTGDIYDPYDPSPGRPWFLRCVARCLTTKFVYEICNPHVTRFIWYAVHIHDNLIGSLPEQSIPGLTVQSDVIKRVTIFELVGVSLFNDLSWEVHVNTICMKVASLLYYLKQLRHAGLSWDDLSYSYLTVIRPVLEYGCTASHHDLTVAQSPKLESLQKRALRIIHYIAFGMPYDSPCAYTG